MDKSCTGLPDLSPPIREYIAPCPVRRLNVQAEKLGPVSWFVGRDGNVRWGNGFGFVIPRSGDKSLFLTSIVLALSGGLSSLTGHNACWNGQA
jgi:hypothetical protein